jgi:hypothetical protein
MFSASAQNVTPRVEHAVATGFLWPNRFGDLMTVTPTPPAPPQLSPDGQWWWDGTTWTSATDVPRATTPMSDTYFNPPPNWPVPEDWEPPICWHPDPAWGPAPANWDLWIFESGEPVTPGPETTSLFHRDFVRLGERSVAVQVFAALLAMAVLIGIGVAVMSTVREDHRRDQQAQRIICQDGFC